MTISNRRLSFKQIFTLAWNECRGAGRRFIFFIICLAIGVGAVMTIQSFSKILEQAIQKESKGLLAADIVISSSWEQSDQDKNFQKQILPPQTEFAFIKELNAMARFPSSVENKTANILAEIKSIPSKPPYYPFYGELKTRPALPLSQLISGNGAIVEPNFLIKTNLKLGNTFQLGATQVKITGIIEAEPDRISRAFSIGPRVMISHETLGQAKLIAPGSRVKHKTFIHLPSNFDVENAASLLQKGLKDKATSMRTFKDKESSLTNSIDRMGKYLGSVGVIALLMGGIGIAMIIKTFMAQKLDTIAILNCLGASSKTIFTIYLIQSLLLGLVGSLLGVSIGYAFQHLLPSKLSDLLTLKVEPEFMWEPAIQSLLLGVITTLLFTLWPLIRAVRTRPLRLFRHIAEEEELVKGSRRQRWLMGTIFSIGLAGMIFWQAESIKRGLVFLLALIISACLLSGISLIILKLIRKLPPSKRMTRRYGLANLYRPNNQAASIITALGMGIMLVLTIRLVQMDMVSMLNGNTEARPPNFFFIDIQRDQTQTFEKVVESIAPNAEKTLTPLVRSRFHSIDERRADSWKYNKRHEEEWFITREFVTTYMADPPERDNTIVKGKWWSKDEASKSLVSIEEDGAKRLGASIGSQLTMDIQGIKISATVTSIRKVNWRNMRTNFYMIFSPGALEGAPVTFVSTVNVDKEKELPLQQAVVQALPNITALGTRDIVETVESVVNKLLTLVDFMSGFAIFSGLFILSGAVASTKFRRLKESAILKTLGAKRQVVASILGYEYAVLGIIAAGIGVFLSLGLSWGIMEYVVKSDWHFRITPLGWAFLAAVFLTTITGILSSWDVLKNKPIYTLRKVDI